MVNTDFISYSVTLSDFKNEYATFHIAIAQICFNIFEHAAYIKVVCGPDTCIIQDYTYYYVLDFPLYSHFSSNQTVAYEEKQLCMNCASCMASRHSSSICHDQSMLACMYLSKFLTQSKAWIETVNFFFLILA